MFMPTFVSISNQQLEGKILQVILLYLTIHIKGTFEMFWFELGLLQSSAL
jgi:hypothetical protein